MMLSTDEYSKLTPDEQRIYDDKQKKREMAEQAALPYRWTQKLDHVEVNVTVPPGTRGRQVQVTFKPTLLQICVQGQVVVETTVHGRSVRVHEPTPDDNVLCVHLEKVNQNEWWAHVLTHDPKIDTTKIAPEDSSLSDLDGETRYVCH